MYAILKVSLFSASSIIAIATECSYKGSLYLRTWCYEDWAPQRYVFRWEATNCSFKCVIAYIQQVVLEVY